MDANNELRLLRGQMQDERSRREQLMSEQQTLISQLQQQLVGHEQDMMRRLREARDD